jgi:DeoD family purine-nucleoside phosphorylase
VPEQRVPSPIHLNPAAEVAERVLLPGDPHRALAVATELLTDTRILNQRRGLWGYTGTAPDGRPVTVQATGMGGPSAAIVVEELIALGARRLIRIGTCGALVSGLQLGELLAAREAIAADGASRALGADGRVGADPGLLEALVAAGARPGTVVSTDLFYDPREGAAAEWTTAGAEAVEMEAAAIFQVARRRGVRAACLLAVSDLLGDDPRRIGVQALEEAGIALGRVALDALAAGAPAKPPLA